MATQDKKQVLKELLESGKQKGRLTTKEISVAGGAGLRCGTGGQAVRYL